MQEIHYAARNQVNWRAAIRLVAKQICSVRVVEASSTNMQIVSKNILQTDQEYEFRLEVPEINGLGQPDIILCRVVCTYVILSGSVYRAGLSFRGLTEDQKTLITRRSARLTSHP